MCKAVEEFARARRDRQDCGAQREQEYHGEGVAADGIRPKGGSYVLTSGGKFAGATVSLAADAPDWVKSVSVVDGDIVLDVKPTGFLLIVK